MDEDFLRKKYIDEGLSTRQISRQISSARSTVVNALKRFGIPLRPEAQARHLRTGQVRFGRRIIRGREVEHHREQRNLEMMQALRKRGKSYREIAAALTALKIPTKNRREEWAAATVMKILKTNSLTPGTETI